MAICDFDAVFVLALLNGAPLPVDFSARAQYLASLPPGAEGLRNWAMKFDFAGEVEPNKFIAPDSHRLTDVMNFRHAVQFIGEHSKRQKIIQRHAAEWPAVASLLRDHIDLWIQSGYDAHGRETPWMRYLPGGRWSRYLPGRLPGVLLDKLNSFQAQNLLTHVSEWGELVATLRAEPPAGEDFATHEAARLMVALLSSDFKYTIAKCQKCRTYFERSKLQECFKRGAYCAKHSKGAGSTIERKDERKALLDLAVKLWPQWKPDEQPNRALWIASKINEERSGNERRITQKWVSINIDVHTGEIKEGKHHG